VPLWLLIAGCIEEQRTRLVPPASGTEAVVARSFNRAGEAPATEATAKRVNAVGRVVVTANPQTGLRPVFITIGAPKPEIFHRGTGALSGCQIIVSEGLVSRCANDGQLAAVLCRELGRVVTEREALASPDQRHGEPSIPMEVAVGPDAGGAFGPSDGTRLMEVGKIEKQRRKPGNLPQPLPSPDVLAGEYLKRAGYAPVNLEQVQPLLREAEQNFGLEKAFPAVVKTVPPPPPAPPGARTDVRP
jgi:hypothetical protein